MKTFTVCRHVYADSDALFFLIYALPLLLLAVVMEIQVSVLSPIPSAVYTHVYGMAGALVPPGEQGADSDPHQTHTTQGITTAHTV